MTKENDKKSPPGLQSQPPPPDEFLGRNGKKKKAGGGKQRPPKTQVEEQIDAALAKSGLQTQRKAKKKLYSKLGAGGVVVVLISVFINWTMAPYTGSMAFGVCRTFLENTLRFPGFLRISTVEEFESFVRIWYTQVDSFGQSRMEPIQCHFRSDEELGTVLDKVLINRREVDQSKVEEFNRILPAIFNMPLDLTVPSPLPDSLQDLQFETDKFRKPIL